MELERDGPATNIALLDLFGFLVLLSLAGRLASRSCHLFEVLYQLLPPRAVR